MAETTGEGAAYESEIEAISNPLSEDEERDLVKRQGSVEHYRRHLAAAEGAVVSAQQARTRINAQMDEKVENAQAEVEHLQSRLSAAERALGG